MLQIVSSQCQNFANIVKIVNIVMESREISKDFKGSQEIPNDLKRFQSREKSRDLKRSLDISRKNPRDPLRFLEIC